MKKEKEWLKDEVKSLFDEAYNSGKMKYYESEESIHRINSLIDQLDEPDERTQLEEAYKDILERHIFYYNKVKYQVIKEQIIPQFVAEFIEANNLHGNNPLREYRYLESDFNEGWTNEEDATVYHWINKNPYAFIDALRYGYEVEKEKLYYVLDSEDIPLLERANNQTCKTTTALSIYEDGRDNSRFALTEKEIKDYDPRFWQFALPVEEEAE